MQTAAPVSTMEATQRCVKILYSTYAKEDLEQVAANETYLNTEERNQLLSLLKDFGELFGGTLGDWDIDLAKIELNPNYKPFNCKYYPVPIINKDTFKNSWYKSLNTLPPYLLYLGKKGL